MYLASFTATGGPDADGARQESAKFRGETLKQSVFRGTLCP